MKKYFYKDNIEAKRGDICFYSEFGKGSLKEHHYADSIVEIFNHKGTLKVRARIITTNNAKNFIEYYEKTEHTVSLEFCCCKWANNPNELQHLTKIGEIGKNNNMLNVEYAINNYAIKK